MAGETRFVKGLYGGALLVLVAAALTSAAMGSEVSSSKSSADSSIPVACQLGAFTPEEQQRHSELMAMLAPILQSPRELENGFAFPLAATPEQFVAVAEWITLERKCCPFLQFDLQWPPSTNTPELRLTGGPGVKEFIAAQWAAKE
jgi:hypothetical protein